MALQNLFFLTTQTSHASIDTFLHIYFVEIACGQRGIVCADIGIIRDASCYVC